MSEGVPNRAESVIFETLLDKSKTFENIDCSPKKEKKRKSNGNYYKEIRSEFLSKTNTTEQYFSKIIKNNLQKNRVSYVPKLERGERKKLRDSGKKIRTKTKPPARFSLKAMFFITPYGIINYLIFKGENKNEAINRLKKYCPNFERGYRNQDNQIDRENIEDIEKTLRTTITFTKKLSQRLDFLIQLYLRKNVPRLEEYSMLIYKKTPNKPVKQKDKKEFVSKVGFSNPSKEDKRVFSKEIPFLKRCADHLSLYMNLSEEDIKDIVRTIGKRYKVKKDIIKKVTKVFLNTYNQSSTSINSQS